jgi:hypothetical protein
MKLYKDRMSLVMPFKRLLLVKIWQENKLIYSQQTVNLKPNLLSHRLHLTNKLRQQT